MDHKPDASWQMRQALWTPDTWKLRLLRDLKSSGPDLSACTVPTCMLWWDKLLLSLDSASEKQQQVVLTERMTLRPFRSGYTKAKSSLAVGLLA